MLHHISLGGAEITLGQVQCRAQWIRLDYAKSKASLPQSVTQGQKECEEESFEFTLKQSPSSELNPDSNPIQFRVKVPLMSDDLLTCDA